jgi:valyl-tRNA synthetase
VWSWWQEGSVHLASWPGGAELDAAFGGAQAADGDLENTALAVTADVLSEVRKAKSQARRPMRARVTRAVVHDSAERLAALELGAEDLRGAGSIGTIEKVVSQEFAVDVELEEETAD